MMGNMVSTLSLTRLQKYSLFQKYKARSATLQRGVSSRLIGSQTSATHLEMGTGHGFCQLIEQRLLDFGELCGIHHLEYVFHLIEKHDLFCAVHLWPVAEKAQDHLQCRLVNHSKLGESLTHFLSQRSILLQKLHDTIR
jgi:hypothetical protein